MATIRLIRFAVLGAAIGAALTVGTGPVGAGGCLAGPGHGDGRIRDGSDPYIGQTFYNCDGTNQTVSLLLDAGAKATFSAKWLNDGSGETKFRFNGTPSGDLAEFKVKFLVGGKDVTDKVIEPGPGKVVKHVATGSSTKTLKLVIKARDSADPSDDISVIMLAYRNGDDNHYPDRVVAAADVPF
jgi:hypothetical protein